MKQSDKKIGMLKLVRKVGQKIMVGDEICITLLEMKGTYASIGIDAPKDVGVYRYEVWEKIQSKSGDELGGNYVT